MSQPSTWRIPPIKIEDEEDTDYEDDSYPKVIPIYNFTTDKERPLTTMKEEWHIFRGRHYPCECGEEDHHSHFRCTWCKRICKGYHKRCFCNWEEKLQAYNLKVEEEEEEEPYAIDVGKELNQEQTQQLTDLLYKYHDIFAWEKSDIGRSNMTYHSIDLTDARPIRHQPRRVSPDRRKFIQAEIQQMLEAGFIHESNSEYASGVVVVEKKGGDLRFCVDYRDLNKKTKKDSYPLPRIDDTLETLQGSQWFSSLDLASGYWQVEMKPEDIHKTAFITHH